MIVKVQLSQFTTEAKQMMLIYNEDQEVFYEAEATDEIIKVMGKKPKKYFNADLNKEGRIILNYEVRARKW